MADVKREAVYPFLIFKEAGRICRQNLAKLSAIYLIFYIPYLFLSGLAIVLPGDQSNMLGIIATLLGLWSSVALLVAANKAVRGETFRIGESAIGAKQYFLSYLGVNLLIPIFIIGVLFAWGSFALGNFILVAKINVIAAFVLQIVFFVAAICLLVYFMIRWALGGAACVLENMRPVDALKRSRILIKDYVNPVVGEYFLFIMATLLAAIPYLVLVSILGNSKDGMEIEMLIGAVNNIIINSMLIPFMFIIMVVLYKKLKEVNEANVRA